MIYQPNELENIYIFISNEHSTQLHTHPFLELVYVLEGSATHILDEQETVVRKGDFFFLDYGSYHSYQSLNNEDFRIMNCLFHPQFIDQSLMNCRCFNDLLNNYLIRLNSETLKKNPSHYVFHDTDQRILQYMNHMLEEFQGKKVGYLELIRCSLVELIIYAMRKISSASDSQYSSITQTVISVISERYREHLTLSEIAEEHRFSLPYLSRKFKSETGLSFCEYLQKVRIEQSCHLLSSTDKKIIEVAEASGYSDVNFFGEVFRKTLHMSPGEYRRLSRLK